jgi:oligopeptide/dipeptide ABC transporter ATP-binding protein
MSLLIISHDIGVISTLAEEIIVMYAGEIIEQDNKENIIKNAQHPYSKKLINAALELQNGCKELTIVEGSVPRPHENIIGCKFAPRCEFCTEKCLNEKPPTILKSNGTGRIKCWKYIKD